MPATIDLRFQGHTAGLVSATGQLLLCPAGADGEAIPVTNVCTDATSLAGQIDARIAELERPKVVAMLHLDLARRTTNLCGMCWCCGLPDL
jgi:hypothetical protein